MKKFIHKKNHSMFEFDLQLFGGKSTGKLIGSLLTGLAAAQFGFFGSGLSWMSRFIMGASLFSTIWMVTHKPDMNKPSSVSRFDRDAEGMSSEEPIKIVYGQRQITGNQTYHHTDADANTLFKHVVLCEGGIYGIDGISAEGLAIPAATVNRSYESTTTPVKTTQGNIDVLQTVDIGKPISGRNIPIATSSTVFVIRNRKYDSWAYSVSLSGKTLTLHTKDKTINLALKGEDELQDGGSFWDWQISVPSLVAYINRAGYGWECFPVSTTKNYPDKLRMFQSGDKYIFTADCVTGGSRYSFHNNQTPSNYEEVGGYPETAWIDALFKVDDSFSGNPSLEVLVRGRVVYDTRYNLYCYSTNPAMCLRDFLLNKRFGGGYWISEDLLDEDSFKEAADWCDEYIQFENNDGSIISVRRYELNIVIDNTRTLWDWVEDILASFCGFIVMSKGKLCLRIEKQTPISYRFDESNIKDISISQMSIDDCPNRYEICFVDPANNWKSAKVLVEDYSDQFDRNKIVTKEVNLEGVTSQNQALRLGRFYRDFNKICSINVSFKTGYQAMHLEPGDVVTLTYKKALVDMPIRISEIKENEDGEYEITGRQYNDTIYNDSLGATLTAYSYCQQKVMVGVISPPCNVEAVSRTYLDSIGILHHDVFLKWEHSPYSLSKTYDVYRKEGNGVWTFLNNTSNNTLSIDEPVGVTVQYGVRTRANDKQSDIAYSNSLSVTSKDEPPSRIVGIELILTGNVITAEWNPSVEPDFRRYKVVANNKTLFTTSPFVKFDAIQGTNRIKVYSEDNGGHFSDESDASLEVDLTPDLISNFRGIASNGSIILSWDKSENADSYVIGGYKSTTINTLLVEFPIKATGEYAFSIAGKNKYGVGKITEITISVSESDLEKDPNMITEDLLIGGTCVTACYVENNKLYLKKKE